MLPFKLRAKGMMIMNLTVQAILALSAQTNLLAWNNLPHHWNFMLFYTVSSDIDRPLLLLLQYSTKLTLALNQLWDTVELVFVYFVYVETKGPTLEEIARIFDGDDAVAHISLTQVEKEIHAAQHEEDVTENFARSEKTAA